MKNEFVYNPASNDGVDSEYILLRNPNITVQDCRSYGGGWAVSEWFEEECALLEHGEFKFLKSAMQKAINLA